MIPDARRVDFLGGAIWATILILGLWVMCEAMHAVKDSPIVLLVVAGLLLWVLAYTASEKMVDWCTLISKKMHEGNR